mgnify:FL=1
MSHYKPYPAYRDSGVEWIGQVPEHWKKMPFKRVASICNGHDYKEVENADGAYPVIGSGGEFARASDFMFDGESVLLGRKGTIDKPLYINGPFWAVDTMFYTKIADNAFPKFVYYNALTIPFGLYSTNTALPSMAGEDLSSHVIAAPDFEEQKAIATGVDRETTRIDALIAKKTRFIELLKEKRQALITHAVTKGLDTNVPMRDSKSEWIGEVPEHWRVCSLGYLSRISTGGTPDRKNDSYWNGEIPWVKTGEINYKIISDTEERITDAGLSNSATFIAEPGTILMAMYGMGVTRGRVAVLGIPASFNQACAAISCSSGVHNWYVFYCLCAAYRFIRDLGNEASQVNLNLEIVSKIKVPVPPLLEQEEIEKHLVAQLQKLDAIEQRVSNSISLIKERRSAFITAAVTGQIDLRESA